MEQIIIKREQQEISYCKQRNRMARCFLIYFFMVC